jgi:hypothetical protein
MADGVSFDFTELTRLAADLESVPKNIGPFLESAIKFTSVNVKRAASRKVGRRKHFKQAAAAIDFEVKHFSGFGVKIIQSEIGYDKERPAGELGNLVEFGAPGSPNALTPGNELATSLHENEEDFMRGVERAEEDARRKAGL